MEATVDGNPVTLRKMLGTFSGWGFRRKATIVLTYMEGLKMGAVVVQPPLHSSLCLAVGMADEKDKQKADTLRQAG